MNNIEISVSVTRVSSMEHLKEILKDGKEKDFRLALNGSVFSRKTIRLNGKGKFWIYHHIDDTEEVIPESELLSENIGLGIQRGCLFLEPEVSEVSSAD
jgi:hypothetical protein